MLQRVESNIWQLIEDDCVRNSMEEFDDILDGWGGKTNRRY